MKCFLYDFSSNYGMKNFLNNNCIIQQDFMIKFMYNGMNKFNYNYVVCMDNDKIKGVMPFIMYKSDLGNILHSMPFVGYGGIAAIENDKENVFKCILDYLQEISKEQNVCLITICTRPFHNDEYELYKEMFKPDFERKNFYQYLNLSEDIFKNMKSKFRGNLRRNISKSEKYGVNLVENYSMEYLKKWYDNVYVKRLTETHCSIYPLSIFQTILNKFDKDKYKMVYAMLDDKIIGGGLYLNQGISVDNFMRVVDADYFYTQAGTYLDNYSINYAIDLGVKYYNWQSCDEVGSSIYKYKEDWGSKLDYHYYLTKIVGDVSKIKATSLDVIKNEYKGIYVMPYEEF